VLTGLLDNLDGAVAVITGKTSRWGYLLDSVVDRFSDAALLLALWLAGAPGPVVVAAGFFGFAQEYSRARAAAAGVSEVGVVSISERPTRVIIVAVFLALAAWAPYGLSAGEWASIGAAAAAVVAAFSFFQVLLKLRSRLV
jgi:CDP-diacylglycerol--glycerol-3-phosphate 3-phosphatidyltransferase